MSLVAQQGLPVSYLKVADLKEGENLLPALSEGEMKKAVSDWLLSLGINAVGDAGRALKEVAVDVVEAKRELRAMADASVEEGDFFAAFCCVAKADHLDYINDLIYRRGLNRPEDVRAMLLAAWTSSELPTRNWLWWLSYFRLAGYTSDTDERLKADTRIYRGVSHQRYARGMSWTLDRELAEWFARRFCNPCTGWHPRVYTTATTATRVLGYFTERNEHEVVVDPRSLPPLRGHMIPVNDERMAGAENGGAS